MNLFQIMRCEFLQALHDPRRFIFLFGASIAYLLFFKLLYSINIIKSIPMVIYDAENTKLSREIVTGFYDSENFKIVAQIDTEEKMLDCLKEKRAFAALEIPEDFSKKLYRKARRQKNIADNDDFKVLGNPLQGYLFLIFCKFFQAGSKFCACNFNVSCTGVYFIRLYFPRRVNE